MARERQNKAHWARVQCLAFKRAGCSTTLHSCAKTETMALRNARPEEASSGGQEAKTLKPSLSWTIQPSGREEMGTAWMPGVGAVSPGRRPTSRATPFLRFLGMSHMKRFSKKFSKG